MSRYSVFISYPSGHQKSIPCETLGGAIAEAKWQESTAGLKYVAVHGEGAEGGYGDDGSVFWDGLSDDERETVNEALGP